MKLQDKENELIKAAHESNITPELLASVDEAFEEADMEFLAEEFPTAIAQAQSGVERIAQIVQAMKEFSHPGDTNLKPANINKAIETTQTVTRSEWKLIADFETDFDQDMPMIPCLISEFNQVVLNMIINARDAISDCLEKDPGQKGKISISTKVNGSRAEIRISDTGGGIPQSVQDKIFDPFFTTKEVGKGSGQGLAISRAVIVDKHKGELDFETQEGKGTTFIIRLPLN
jgi:signal transduction histidine kinase